MSFYVPRSKAKTEKGGIRFKIILLLTSAVLSLPAVLSGWMNDDYFFDTPLYETDAPFGYYDFMERFGEARLLPWWISESYQLRFFRPLASLDLHLDFLLFGARPLGAHLHSLAWSLLLLLGGFSLLQRCLSDRRTARLAMVIFTLAICHAWGAGWIAARNGVMSGAFAVWSAAFYLGWRQGEGRRFGIASAVTFVLGLLAGEVALSLPPFLLCFEVAFAEEPWSKRLAFLWPTAAITAVYLIFYGVCDYGAAGSGAYINPLSHPEDYAAGLLPKVLAVIGSFSFGIPAIVRSLPGAEMMTSMVGGLGLLLLIAGLLLARPRIGEGWRRSLGWLILAVFLPMLPAVSGLAQGREFVLSAIAFSAVAATVFRALVAMSGSLGRRVLPFGVAGLMFLGLLLINPLSRLGQSFFIYKSSELMVDAGRNSEVQCPDGAPVYVINGDFMRSVGFPFAIARHQGVRFPSWQQLITPESDIRLERTASDRIVVSSDAKPLINDFLALYRRPDEPFATGDKFETEYLQAEVLAVSEGRPVRIAFTLPGLDRPGGVCLLRYDADVLKTWSAPPVGETTVVKFVAPM